MARRAVALAALVCSGCFAEVTTAYMPSMTIRVAQGTAAPVEHREGAFTVAFNLGVYLDLYGAGLHYGFLGATGVRGASGLPEHFGAAGWRLRGDLDLPVRFGPGHFFGLRGTYAYQKLSEGGVGPRGDGADDDVPAHGSAQMAGLTLTGYTNDDGLTIGIMHLDLDTEPLREWPGLHADGTGVAASFLIRFIPSSGLMKYYIDKPVEFDPGKPFCYSEHYEPWGITFTHGCG
ncbi:MAG TPA: hypothetical protein VL463_01910 [Kofleriaceae bacterium]|nr:hypothetical protein [Kofleriaceae bacterium]